LTINKSKTEACVVEQVNSQVGVAWTNNFTVLFGDFPSTRVGCAEVEVSDLTAVSGSVFNTSRVLLLVSETFWRIDLCYLGKSNTQKNQEYNRYDGGTHCDVG